MKKLTYFLALSLAVGSLSIFPLRGVTANENVSIDLPVPPAVQMVFPESSVPSVKYFGVPSDYSGNEPLSEYKSRKMSEYAKALGIIQKYIQENNVNIALDLDDRGFVRFVFSLGVNLDAFSEEDREVVLQFVKFMDLYEAIGKNQELKQYEEKIKAKKSLSSEEQSDFKMRLPATPESIVKPEKLM